MNRFSAADWAIVLGYFALTAAIGLLYTRRAGASTSEFFIGGRNVPWWLAGVSMVATTFAADTPLAVTELVAKYGVAGNWLWWNMVMSGILTVFFFARLWRRANVMTDVELAEVRYGGRPAAALRGFRAVYLAIPINLIVLGWVNKAMVTILEVSLGINPLVAVGICFVVTVAYSAAAGLWAVLWTDAVQFVIMMTAVIVLAVFAVAHVGGMAALKAQVTAQYAGGTDPLSVLPVQLGGGISGYVFMPLLTLLVFLSVQWWAAWYPGAEPGGGGYVAQRIFAARTERDGVLATLFFQVAHYALRPWPWIITALATTVMYPTLGPDEKGKGYVMAYMDLLPSPLKGLMLAGFAAAYMSTVATQLNWGASYLVNDVYRRFLRPTASEASSVNAGRVATVLLFLASVVVSWQIDTIAGAWQLLIAVGAGTGLVLILRWYWWRVNAWSEISAMAASFVVSLVAMQVIPPLFPRPADPAPERGPARRVDGAPGDGGGQHRGVAHDHVPDPSGAGRGARRVLPPGAPGRPGWARVSERLGYGREPIPGGALAWTNWVAGVVAVYASLFGIGKVVFGESGPGLAMLAVAAARSPGSPARSAPRRRAPRPVGRPVDGVRRATDAGRLTRAQAATGRFALPTPGAGRRLRRFARPDAPGRAPIPEAHDERFVAARAGPDRDPGGRRRGQEVHGRRGRRVRRGRAPRLGAARRLQRLQVRASSSRTRPAEDDLVLDAGRLPRLHRPVLRAVHLGRGHRLRDEHAGVGLHVQEPERHGRLRLRQLVLRLTRIS
jgi:Na+/proline symporter